MPMQAKRIKGTQNVNRESKTEYEVKIYAQRIT